MPVEFIVVPEALVPVGMDTRNGFGLGTSLLADSAAALLSSAAYTTTFYPFHRCAAHDDVMHTLCMLLPHGRDPCACTPGCMRPQNQDAAPDPGLEPSDHLRQSCTLHVCECNPTHHHRAGLLRVVAGQPSVHVQASEPAAHGPNSQLLHVTRIASISSAHILVCTTAPCIACSGVCVPLLFQLHQCFLSSRFAHQQMRNLTPSTNQ